MADLVLDVDWDITKAEAKQRKLNREFDESQRKAGLIKDKINELNSALDDEKMKQKEIKGELEDQNKEMQKFAAQVDKVKSGNATIQEVIDLGPLDAAENKLSEMQTAIEKNNTAYDKSLAASKKNKSEISKQNYELDKQNNKTAEIGDKILLNSKKQNKFAQAFEKSQKSADRFGKRLKSLIASALFFSVVTKAFTALRNEFGKFITESGTKTATLVSQIKNNLAVLGRTLYEGAKPYIEWLLEKLAQITQLLAVAVAKALGKDIKEMKALADSTKKTGKEAEKTTASFDTMQKLSTGSTDGEEDSSETSTTLPKQIGSYDEVIEELNEILRLVGNIGVGLLTWKLSKTFLGSLGSLSASLGLTLAVDSVIDVLTDGLSWESVIKGSVGGALVGAGIGLKFGGPAGALLGATIGIGVMLLVQGITSMLKEGITTENVTTTIAGALGTAASIIGTVKFFNGKTKSAAPELQKASETIENTSNGTNTLTDKLKNLATNLAWGILIIAEVAVAAGIIVGAIWGLGVLLEQVGIAWQPVIDNGGTIAAAMGIGIGILAAIGIVTALLGTLGGAMAGQIAIGIAILAEIGVATGLFIAEIWAIGKGLDEVGKAWQPVLDNGDTIKTGIATGTTLLIGIGVVTAALGVATVATAGALPLAIGLGTAILVELGIAFVAFVGSLVDVADNLSLKLHPALTRLNIILPGLSENMEDFTGFMKTFAGHVVKYTKSSSIAGLSSTVDSIVKFFTKDPIESLASDAEKQYKQSSKLNDKLRLANPELNSTISLLKKFFDFLTKIEDLTNKIGGISFKSNILVHMPDVSLVGSSVGTTVGNGSVFSFPYRAPQLATGAILPGGSPMLAWVNDQPKGQPYLEGSVENIAAAFEKYLGDRNFGNQNINLVAKGPLAPLIRLLALEIQNENNRVSVF